MAFEMKKRFVSSTGETFVVEEVVQGPAGLTVYYIRENDQTKFSCLIDAFAERFKEIAE